MYPPFVLWEGLNQNPQRYTRDYSNQVTHISQFRPFSSKGPISYLWKTPLVPFKTSFGHSSSFYSLSLSFNIFLPIDPTVSRGSGFGQLHSVYFSSHLWFDPMYSLPISNWPLCHPVYFWVNNNFCPPIIIWTWIHPVNLQFLKLHPKITPCQNSLTRSFWFSLYIPHNLLRKCVLWSFNQLYYSCLY